MKRSKFVAIEHYLWVGGLGVLLWAADLTLQPLADVSFTAGTIPLVHSAVGDSVTYILYYSVPALAGAILTFPLMVLLLRRIKIFDIALVVTPSLLFLLNIVLCSDVQVGVPEKGFIYYQCIGVSVGLVVPLLFTIPASRIRPLRNLGVPGTAVKGAGQYALGLVSPILLAFASVLIFARVASNTPFGPSVYVGLSLLILSVVLRSYHIKIIDWLVFALAASFVCLVVYGFYAVNAFKAVLGCI